MSPFNKMAHKLTKFGGKVISGSQKLGNKIIHTADKGLGIGNKILDIADKAAGALESVPVIGEVAGASRGFIKQGKNVLKGANAGLDRLESANNKLQRIKL